MTKGERETLATMAPVFEKHGVSEPDRAFLYCAFDRLIEEDIDHERVSDIIAHAVIGTDSYDELLQQHNRGHRRNRAWFTSVMCEEAKPTAKGRALLRDLVAINPHWQDAQP